MNELELLERIHKVELDVTSIKSTVNAIHEEMKHYNKEINGNGKPGIKQDIVNVNKKVDDLCSDYKNFYKNAMAVIGIVTFVAQIVASLASKLF